VGSFPGRKLVGCFSKNEIAIGPRENAFPGPAVALDGPRSMVDVIGSIVISLSRCCLPNDEGPGPPKYFFLEPPLIHTTLAERRAVKTAYD